MYILFIPKFVVFFFFFSHLFPFLVWIMPLFLSLKSVTYLFNYYFKKVLMSIYVKLIEVSWMSFVHAQYKRQIVNKATYQLHFDAYPTYNKIKNTYLKRIVRTQKFNIFQMSWLEGWSWVGDDFSLFPFYFSFLSNFLQRLRTRFFKLESNSSEEFLIVWFSFKNNLLKSL